MKKSKEAKDVTSMEKKKSNRTYRLVLTGILSAIAIVLMYFEFSVPFMPPFLKMDFSEIPVLFGAFALGPLAAIAIEFIKNLFHLPTSGTAYVGELANFLAGVAFAGTAGWVFKYLPTRKKGNQKDLSAPRAEEANAKPMSAQKRVILGMAAGTIAMTIFTSFFNYFFMIDFYSRLFGVSMDVIVKMTAELNRLVTDLHTLVVFAFIPFNLFKGIVISVITGFLYGRLAPILRKR